MSESKLKRLEEQYWKYHNKAERIKARIERLGGEITHPLLEDPSEAVSEEH